MSHEFPISAPEVGDLTFHLLFHRTCTKRSYFHIYLKFKKYTWHLRTLPAATPRKSFTLLPQEGVCPWASAFCFKVRAGVCGPLGARHSTGAPVTGAASRQGSECSRALPGTHSALPPGPREGNYSLNTCWRVQERLYSRPWQ